MKRKEHVHKVVIYADVITVCGKECGPGVTASRVWAQVTCPKCLDLHRPKKR